MCHPTDKDELDATESIRSSVQEEHSREGNKDDNNSNYKVHPMSLDSNFHAKLRTESDSENGCIILVNVSRRGVWIVSNVNVGQLV